MRLARFILRDMEHILSQWEAFAATHVPAASSMSPLQLRDHARDYSGGRGKGFGDLTD